MTTEHGPQAQNRTPEVTLLKCRLSYGPIAPPPPPRTERKNKLADDWKEEKKHEQRGGAEGGPQRQPTNILVSKTAPQKAAHTQNRFGSGA